MKLLPKIDIYGVPVTRASADEMVSAAREVIRRRDGTHFMVAVNAHTYTESLRSPGFRSIMDRAFIAWADGVSIKWAARLSGAPDLQRIHGHDLLKHFLREPFSHFFYGSTPETLERLKRRLPGVRIAGTCSPPLMRRAETSDVSEINDSGADILWVGLGAPKQELWTHLNHGRIRVPLIGCVGAAFDIMAGRFTRAPRPLQHMGLEWAWRLAQDPVRLWRRYLSTNGAFVTYIMRSWVEESCARAAGK